MQVYHDQLESEPGFRQRQISLENATTMRLRSARAARSKLYKLTVVVHVVYSTAAENISSAQVTSQITALNKDYRAKNPDRSKTPAPWKGLVSDPYVEFALATKDPRGKPTNGITRTKTKPTAFIVQQRPCGRHVRQLHGLRRRRHDVSCSPQARCRACTPRWTVRAAAC